MRDGACLARFKQSDLVRALKGAKTAGLNIARVEIDPAGKIVMLADDRPMKAEPASPFDEWKAKHAS